MPQRPGMPSEQVVASRLKALSPAEYQRQIGSHPVLSSMVRHNVPLTRDNYVALANTGRPDEARTAEHEANVPRILLPDEE